MSVTTAHAEWIEGHDVWKVDLFRLDGTFLRTRFVNTERGALRVMSNHSKRGWV